MYIEKLLEKQINTTPKCEWIKKIPLKNVKIGPFSSVLSIKALYNKRSFTESTYQRRPFEPHKIPDTVLALSFL